MEFIYYLVNDCISEIFTKYDDTYLLFELSASSNQTSAYFNLSKYITLRFDQLSILSKFNSIQSLNVYADRNLSHQFVECKLFSHLINLTSVKFRNLLAIKNIETLTSVIKFEFGNHSYCYSSFPISELKHLTYLDMNNNNSTAKLNQNNSNLRYFKGVVNDKLDNFEINNFQQLQYLNIKFNSSGMLTFDSEKLNDLIHIKLQSVNYYESERKDWYFNFNENIRVLKLVNVSIEPMNFNNFLLLEKLTLSPLKNTGSIEIINFIYLTKLHVGNYKSVSMCNLTNLLHLKISNMNQMTIMENIFHITYLAIKNILIIEGLSYLTDLKRLNTKYDRINQCLHVLPNPVNMIECKIAQYPIFTFHDMINLTNLNLKSDYFDSLDLTNMIYLRKLTVVNRLTKLKINKIVDVVRRYNDKRTFKF